MAEKCFPTLQELRGFGIDADVWRKFINGEIDEVNLNRNGVDVETLLTWKEQVMEIARQAANMQTYLTKAEMEAAGPQPKDTVAQVTNDPDPTNNGYWVSDGSQWIWSGMQPANASQVNSALDLASTSLTEARSKAPLRRAPLAFYGDTHTGYWMVDEDGNVVNGPTVIEALLARIQDLEGGGGQGLGSGPLEPLYFDSLALKSIGTSGPRVLAGISDADFSFEGAPFWRGNAVVATTDRKTVWSKTPSVVLPRGNQWTRDEMVVPSGENLLILIPSYGQSNSVGSQGFTPEYIWTENPWPEHLLMPDGPGFMDVRMGLPSGSESVGSETELDPSLITGFKPLVGMQSELVSHLGTTPLEGMGYALMHAFKEYLGFMPRICVYAAGWGGRFQSQLAEGSIPFKNLKTGAERLSTLARSRGWTPWVPGVVLFHGESDSSRPQYLTAVEPWRQSMEVALKAATGQVGPVSLFAAQASTFQGANTNGVLAHYNAARDNDKVVLTAPYYPYGMAPDNLHLGKTAPAVGEKVAHAIARAYSGLGTGRHGCVFPLSVTLITANQIDIKFSVPRAPLVFDSAFPTVNNPSPADGGFRVFDGSGAQMTITGREIIGGDTVRLTVSGSIASGPERSVDYALEGFPNPKVTGQQPRGQLRDSETVTFYYNGERAYNWCVHFKESF